MSKHTPPTRGRTRTVMESDTSSATEPPRRLHGSPVKRQRRKRQAREALSEPPSEEQTATLSKAPPGESVPLEHRHWVGRFWTHEPLPNLGHYCLLKELAEFFTDDLLRDYLLPLLSPAEGGTGEMSRRVMDWFVVNYTKKWPVMYRWEVRPGWSEEVNVCRNYELHMKKYGKHSLDVFCRNKQRVYFQLDGRVLQSVVAQLNFVRWAIQYGVFQQLRARYDAVRDDHHANMAKSRRVRKEAVATGRHRKRESLSIANPVQSVLRDEPLEVRYA